MCKELSKPNRKKQTIQLESGQKIRRDTSLQRTPRWQMSTRTDVQHHQPVGKCKVMATHLEE